MKRFRELFETAGHQDEIRPRRAVHRPPRCRQRGLECRGIQGMTFSTDCWPTARSPALTALAHIQFNVKLPVPRAGVSVFPVDPVPVQGTA
jgi:hypothetical protein